MVKPRRKPYFQILLNMKYGGFTIEGEFLQTYFKKKRKHNLIKCKKCLRIGTFCKKRGCLYKLDRVDRTEEVLISAYKEAASTYCKDVKDLVLSDKYSLEYLGCQRIHDYDGSEYETIEAEHYVQKKINAIPYDATPEYCKKVLMSLKKENLPSIEYKRKI